MNNHQNAIFHQLDNFMQHSHSFAMTIFHKITKSEKLVILLIIPTYAKEPYINHTHTLTPDNRKEFAYHYSA
jgi:calcineurin-like phosphoesterase